MGRELQKRKRRSSRPTVRPHGHRKKAINPMGNNTITKNWNKKETLTQNYQRFGLVAKLGTSAGGLDTLQRKAQAAGKTAPIDPFKVKPAATELPVAEVRVERDADGKIVRVLHENNNPLNDLLNELDSDNEDGGNAGNVPADQDEEWGGIDEEDDSRPEVVRALEREARQPVEKPVRHQSDREMEWLERLVAKHGNDTAAMARDHKLNPMQQTKADIARRLKKAKLLPS